MIVYLYKSSLCLLALLIFYHLFLEREKMHKFNRFYLLGSVLFSFCAPLFVIYVEATQIPIEAVQSIPLQNTFEIIESQPTQIVEEKFDYTQLLYGFYGLVTLFLFARFFKNITNIFLRIKHNTKIKINNATIVLLDDDVIPHTFWNYIFISKKEYENENFNKELLTHELTHVAQYHTLDILCIELLKIVFWFNPLFYILKRLLQLNHEFLADEKVIKEYKNISNYQSLLLEKSLHATSYQLTSNLNYLVTKKRLTMMTKRTHKYSWLKQLAIAPLLAGLFFVFAERVEAKEVIIEKKFNEKENKYIDAPIQKNGSKQSVSKIGDIEDIRSKLKEINSSKIEYAKDTTKINSKKKEVAKSFLLRNNALSNFQFNNKKYIDDKKIAESKMTEDEKENFRYRNHIVNVSTLNSNSFNYEINGKITNVNEVYDYLLKNPDCLISTKKLSDNKLTLLFSDRENSKMSKNTLQNVYSEIFKLANSTSDIKNEILKEETKSSIKIILEKNGEEIKMECKKGCDWEKIEFKLSHNSPQIVNEKGLNKVNPRNADNNFYFVLLQDENIFDLKSTKNTKWKGLSGSSKEKMKLLINQRTIKSIIEKK